MKGSDKFLLLLLAAIALIVIAALVAVLRAPAPTYQPEETPQGVAHNYLLALRQGDYERAYRYLSPDLPGLPSVAGFADDVARNPWQFERGDNTAVTVEDAHIFGDGTARVSVMLTTFNNGLFSSSYARPFGLTLEPDGDTWRLIDGEDYWDYCWTSNDCEPQLPID
jgi:hypothetical protein